MVDGRDGDEIGEEDEGAGGIEVNIESCIMGSS